MLYKSTTPEGVPTATTSVTDENFHLTKTFVNNILRGRYDRSGAQRQAFGCYIGTRPGRRRPVSNSTPPASELERTGLCNRPFSQAGRLSTEDQLSPPRT